jgi:beta-phosphoglucomutase-like phosphatase (HAD superfamily)
MKLPRRPAAIVFDMDGLLFDTETLYQEAAILAAADRGHDVSLGVFSQTIGLPWPQSRSLLLAHFGLSFPVEEFVATLVRHFEVLAATRLALKPGAIELLNTLDDLGLPRAIATSSARETVEHHLQFHDLVGRFHHIVGHGDYTVGKPAPDPLS